MTHWRSVEWPEGDSDIPKEAGCYVIYLDGALAYIGSSKHLAHRLAHHPMKIRRYSAWIDTPWGSATKILVKFRISDRPGDWLMWEYRLIKRLQPAGNKRGTKRERVRPRAR